MNRRQFMRKYPAPAPTPDGMVWRTRDGLTQLVPEADAVAVSRGKMGNYDLYPRETRDQIKEFGRRAK